MDALHFCRLVLWAALRHSADWAQAIIFVALAVVGAAILLAPQFGVSVDNSALTTLIADPKVYAILFGSVILTRLLCAPYWVWRDERNTARSAASNRGMSVREISAISEQASAIREQAMELRAQRIHAQIIDEYYPNLRIADCPEILEMFHNYDAKLNGLLSSGKLTAWARLMRGDSRLLPLEAEIWITHRLDFYPKSPGSVPAGLNQTFLRSRRGESSHYDICLNISQIKRSWPELSEIAPNAMKL